MSQSRRVLSLYRKILKAGQSWQSATGILTETVKEQNYISNEARTLFQLNKYLTDENSIKAAIKEAESRLEIALHYRNPWPRPSHIPQHSMLPLRDRKRKKSDKILGQSKPAYLRSYDIGDQSKPQGGQD